MKTVNSQFSFFRNREFTVFEKKIGRKPACLVSAFIVPNVTQYYNCEITLMQNSFSQTTNHYLGTLETQKYFTKNLSG